ncbi:MAG TPA: glycosyltransferase family 2 protein [Pirellulaceae bacterium]|nr:glycosyltransferase family 2 protein [Pirellulaceae bacterium]
MIRGRFPSRFLLPGRIMPLETPVALLLYNRPQHTASVLAAIAAAQPRKLLVVGDGPHTDREGDAERVALARAVIERVDWPCEVLTNYAPENLGCQRRVSSGLDWVFGLVEEAIVLEDDCVPDPSFFAYCQALLERYRNDERIASIGGANFAEASHRTRDSYFFSKYFFCWGWASWRRAWQRFDVTMRDWPAWKQNGGLASFAESSAELKYWKRALDAVHGGKTDSWALPFALASFRHGGLNVVPAVNLVSNTGFGDDSTHTRCARHPLANLPVRALGTLQHPATVARNAPADRALFSRCYLPPRSSPWQRLWNSTVRRWAGVRAMWNSTRQSQRPPVSPRRAA